MIVTSRIIPIILVLGLMLATPVAAQSDAARLVDQILDVSADGEALRVLGSDNSQIGGAAEALGPERARILVEAWSASFREDLLRADIITSITQSESVSSIETGLAWLRTPEVTLVTDRFRRMIGAEGDMAFLEWLSGLDENSLDQQRAEIISQISEYSSETGAVEAILALTEASIRAAYAAAPPANRPSLDEVVDHFHVVRETIGMQSLAQNRLYLYFVLNDLSIEQLRAYAAALQQPGGR